MYGLRVVGGVSSVYEMERRWDLGVGVCWVVGGGGWVVGLGAWWAVVRVWALVRGWLWCVLAFVAWRALARRGLWCVYCLGYSAALARELGVCRLRAVARYYVGVLCCLLVIDAKLRVRTRIRKSSLTCEQL